MPAPKDATQGVLLEPAQICEGASFEMTILVTDGLLFHETQHLTLKAMMIRYRDRPQVST